MAKNVLMVLIYTRTTLHSVRFGQFSLPFLLLQVLISQHMVFLIEIALFGSYYIKKIRILRLNKYFL